MKILIVGLGSIAKKHVSALLSIIPDVEIFALRSAHTSNSYPNVKNIFNLDEISFIEIDFSIISNPTSEHKKTITQLLPFGFPLFIEKPLYSTLEIDELVNQINKKNILTYVACNLRFLNCIKFAKDRMKEITNNRLNEVNIYCGSYLPDWRPGSDYKKSYSANAQFGGGVHIDLIHELDYLYWLCGKPNRVNRIFRNKSSLAISSFDYANYLLDYDGFCANVVLNYFRRDPKRSFELVFEDETWSVDLLKNQITCNNQIIFSSEQCIQDTYKIQMEYFVDCVKKQKSTFNSVSEAYNVLKICLDDDIK